MQQERVIYPLPIPWQTVYKAMCSFAAINACVPASPPRPLILAGWVYSNDQQKGACWAEYVRWAEANGCQELLEISQTDFYVTDTPTTHEVGPMGGPLYPHTTHDPKPYPDKLELSIMMTKLQCIWASIAGASLAGATKPLQFTGEKSRALLVAANSEFTPAWGSWTHLSKTAADRAVFSELRTNVNEAIYPHEVDHIKFKVGHQSVTGSGHAERAQSSK